MKNLLLLVLVLSVLFIPFNVKAETNNEIVIHYFMEETCSNCKEVSEYFDDHLSDIENLTIIYYEINVDENRTLWLDALDAFERRYNLVPYVIIGGTDLQGTTEITAYIEDIVTYYQENPDYVDVVEKIENNQVLLPNDFILNPAKKVITLPILGEIELASFSLFLGAMFIGLIDGFNPCAMWVLIFLITMLINLKNKKRVWILGLTFILTSGIIYYIIMISWLQILVNFAMIKLFQILIGILAIGFALFSIKHYWNQRQKDLGCEVTTQKSRRKIMERAQKAIQKNNLFLAIIGIIGIAITVNLIELACSAGLPVVYTSMLAYQNVTSFQSAMYILVYVIFFMLDDILVFAIAVITLRVTGISSKYAKYSNLIGGLIMLFIGLSLIFFPNLLF
ncbi:MAG: hypothetical protein PF513_01450 [Tenericutes bacterium]|jgi:hypothetical protein|nr:hypothetical protein [Mycoplasmatota bacterium]